MPSPSSVTDSTRPTKYLSTCDNCRAWKKVIRKIRSARNAENVRRRASIAHSPTLTEARRSDAEDQITVAAQPPIPTNSPSTSESRQPVLRSQVASESANGTLEEERALYPAGYYSVSRQTVTEHAYFEQVHPIYSFLNQVTFEERMVKLDSREPTPRLIPTTISIKSPVHARNGFKNPLLVLQSEDLIIGVMPMVAMFTVFDFVMHNPLHAETRKNLSYLDIVAAHYARFDLLAQVTIHDAKVAEFTSIARLCFETITGDPANAANITSIAGPSVRRGAPDE
ncbi:transcriptional regulatory [Fusarium acutatum]|uniref:Transcriptional regulatory n=1 Tax=Fusarium acutatum TaxID=78861 RepID=A0A8H4JQD9_9HYPO|nr:transcriptional regulatory [Fusarium acutatum]